MFFDVKINQLKTSDTQRYSACSTDGKKLTSKKIPSLAKPQKNFATLLNMSRVNLGCSNKELLLVNPTVWSDSS